MALKTIRIGSAESVFQYDDAAYDSAIEVDAPIKCDTPVDPTDVVRLQDLGLLGVVGTVAVVTGSRALGGIYQNATGNIMIVQVSIRLST